jgi:hypothetical protein
MATTLLNGGTIPADVDGRFVDLICGDADLLDAEFDAEWPVPPTGGRRRGFAGRHRADGRNRPTGARAHGSVPRPQQPGMNEWARQRSPPVPHRGVTDRKAGDRHT